VVGANSNDRLIQALGADLKPVRRLTSPGLRALSWLAIVGAIALALAALSDVGAVSRRLMAAPDMWLAASGSLATAVLAAFAAFQLSLPDRQPAWALLPLPAAVLWIGASGIGCLRSWIVPETHPASLEESETCLTFILGLSVPLSVLLFVMLRRGYLLRPILASVVGGLACAAAAATLLNFIHPYDATATDLAVHAFAVAIVIYANSLFAGRFLVSKNMPFVGVTGSRSIEVPISSHRRDM
jgi:hypothetical protein